MKESGGREFGMGLGKEGESWAMGEGRSPEPWRRRRKVEMSAGPEGGQKLAGVEADGAGQAEPEELPEGKGGAKGVGAAVEVAQWQVG
jgi:hypothetical protein